ncbi:hypothetical protein SSS_05130 [Sarcoptes scabiei]|nr:hypothetical protein SSS_05130 [Sarcoptes scabiei]
MVPTNLSDHLEYCHSRWNAKIFIATSFILLLVSATLSTFSIETNESTMNPLSSFSITNNYDQNDLNASSDYSASANSALIGTDLFSNNQTDSNRFAIADGEQDFKQMIFKLSENIESLNQNLTILNTLLQTKHKNYLMKVIPLAIIKLIIIIIIIIIITTIIITIIIVIKFGENHRNQIEPNRIIHRVFLNQNKFQQFLHQV